MKPDLDPQHAPEPGTMPDDDLDKQVGDMLDALEERAEDLLDAVAGGAGSGPHPTDALLNDLAESIAQNETPAPTPAPIDADAPCAPETQPDEIPEASGDAVETDEAFHDEIADAPDDPVNDAELDDAIARAVASAEEALERDDGPIEPGDAEPEGVSAHADDEEHADAQASGAPDDGDAELSPGDVEVSESPESSAAARDAALEGAPEPAPSDAATPESESPPPARSRPAWHAVWSRARPVTVRFTGAAARTISRPLVLLDPSLRDYIGYAAAVTAFLGLCVWVIALL